MANPVVAIKNFFQKHGSPVAPYAPAFVNAGTKYGVDPRLIAAIVMKETEGGLTGTGRPGQYNLTGVGGVGHMHSYPNYRASIFDTARNLGRPLYKGKDLAHQTAMWVAGSQPTASTAGYTHDVQGFLRMLGENVPAGKAPSFSPAQVANRTRAAGALPPNPRIGGQNLSFLGSLIGSISGVPQLGAALQALGGGQSSKLPRLIGRAGPQGIPVVSNKPATSTDQKVIQLAHQYLGRPYVYGGRSPKTGFDCSGFVQWLYGQQGIKLGNTTFDQIKQGKPVTSRKALRPGDIVFFVGSDGTRSSPGHEGLYIGNGKFIQSPHTGDVIKISSLDEPYYKRTYVTARRVA